MAAAAASSACGVRAQARSRIPRIGIIHYGSAANFRSRSDAFRREMARLGHTGSSVFFHEEGAYGQQDLLEQTAKTFARERFDVILSASTLTTAVIRRFAADTPIVMAAAEDPVEERFVDSLARPGRNITGVSASVLEHLRRHVELLGQVAPRLTHITALLNPDNATYAKYRSRLEMAARAGTRLTFADARSANDIEHAFAASPRQGSEGMIVMNDGFLYTQRRTIAEAALRAKRPVVYPLRGFVEAGGLMSYGPNLEANFARAAHFVDRILKGERASDIPVEPPARMELAINRDTAHSLKLTLPPELVKEAANVPG